MTTALALAQPTGLVIEAGNPEFEAACLHMAEEYREATANIRAAAMMLKANCDRLYAAFKGELEAGGHCYDPFGIDFYFDGSRRYGEDQLDKIIDGMRRKAWVMLIDRIGVKKVMSVAKRAEFEKQLKDGELPEITAANVVSVILSLADGARDFAKEAAIEVFGILRPGQHRTPEDRYKTNSTFRVGKRVILEWFVSPAYGGGAYRISYSREPQLIAIDGVFHLLAGQGIPKDRRGPLIEAINSCKGGQGETEFFRFKCFKKGTLHLEFKRLDLVKELNYLGTGERVLGEGD